VAIRLCVRKSSSYDLNGNRMDVYDLKCPRCQNIIMFFGSEICPLSCKCGHIIADYKMIYRYSYERIDWHFNTLD